MAGLCGAYGVGHVRYPTSGCNSVEEAQVDNTHMLLNLLQPLPFFVCSTWFESARVDEGTLCTSLA